MAIQSDEFVDQSRLRHIIFLANYGKNHLSFGVRFVADRSGSKDSVLILAMLHGADDLESHEKALRITFFNIEFV